MSQRTRLLTGLLAGAALLGLAFWAVFSPSGERDAAGPDRPAAAEAPAASAPAEEEPGPGERAPLAVAAPPAPAAPTAGPPASYRIALGKVRGRIVEWDGAPVPDLSVDAYVFDVPTLIPALSALFGDEPYRPRILDASAKTDAEGRFVLEDLEPKMPHALLLGLGAARATARFLDDAPSPGETVDLGDIVLPPFAILVGRVVDEKGAGVAGARLRATDLPALVLAAGAAELRPGSAICGEDTVIEIPRWLDDLVDRFPVPTTRTGPDGSFRLEGAPIGTLTLAIDHPRFVTLVHGPVGTAGGGEKEVGKLTLEAGEKLEGVVLDGAGKGVAGAQVLAGTRAPLGDFAVLRDAGKTDAEGKFVVPAMSASAATVAARRGPPDPWTVVGPVSPGLDKAEVRLELIAEAMLLIHDAAGAPVEAEPEVLVRRSGPMSEVAILAPPQKTRTRKGETPGAWIVERIAKGKYDLLVRVPGYAVGKAEIDVAGEGTHADVTLEKSLELAVRVLVDGTDAPVEWAFVGALAGGKGSRFEPPRVSARTDARGTAKLAGLAEGKNRVIVAHPGYAFAESEFELPVEELVVRLRGGGAIAGKVHAGGAPPAQSVFIAAGPKNHLAMPRFTTTDPDGSFKITHVEPGRYELVALPRLLDKTFVGLFELAEGGDMAEEDVTVEEGKTATVELDLKKELEGGVGTVRGRVWINGRAHEGATVRSWSRRSRSAKTDALGNYELTGLPAGEIHLNLALPRDDGMPFGHSLGGRKVKLDAGAVVEVNFEFDTGGIAGRVVSERTGEAVPHAQVWARSKAKGEEDVGWGGPGVMADAEGNFRIPSARAGEYEVFARGKSHAQGNATDVVVPAGGEASGVVVTLPVAIVVKGRVVVDAVPEEARWTGVSFRKKAGEGEGSWGGWARVRFPEGTFETDDLAPGIYMAQFMAGETSYEPIEVTIPEGGTDGLVLRPRPVQVTPAAAPR